MQFKKEDVGVSYRDEPEEKFELYYRPAWDWLLELLLDKDIVSMMEWDAKRLFRYDLANQSWKRFIEDAWTGNRWWKIQVGTNLFV